MAVASVECIPVLRALGEINRLRIVKLLIKRKTGVAELAEQLGLSQYNASKHLRILKEAGLLEMEKEGKRHLYSVSPSLRARLKANSKTLDLGCCTFRFDKLSA